MCSKEEPAKQKERKKGYFLYTPSPESFYSSFLVIKLFNSFSLFYNTLCDPFVSLLVQFSAPGLKELISASILNPFVVYLLHANLGFALRIPRKTILISYLSKNHNLARKKVMYNQPHLDVISKYWNEDKEL